MTKALCRGIVSLGGAGWVLCLVLPGGQVAAEPLVLDELVVTATPLPSASDELAQPVEVLTRDDLERLGGNSLGETLSRLPGVSQSSFAGGASRPIIRGLDNARVRVQENGVGSHDVSAVSEDHGVPIDPLGATKIEIVRGPATLRYGSQAIGGVVHVLNNRIPTKAPDDGFDGAVSGAWSSVDDGLQGSMQLDGGGDGFAVHLDGFGRDSDAYDIPGGNQAFTDVQSSGGAVGGSYFFENGHVGASLAYFESEYGIPAPEDPADPLSIDMEQLKVTVGSEVDGLDGFVKLVRFQGGYTDYTHDEVQGGAVVSSTFDNEQWEGRAEAVHRPIGPFNGAFGLQAGTRDLTASGEGRELLAPAQSDSLAAFLFEEMPLGDRVILQLGGRIERVELDGTGFTFATGNEFAASRSFTPLSGSVGLVVDLDEDLVLGLTAQSVERAPDILELFAKGPHEATETFEIGDTDLDKEQAFSAEASLRREEGPVQFTLSAFHTWFDGFIFKHLTGEMCGEEFATCTGAPNFGGGGELTQIRYDQEDARFYGGEAQARWEVTEVGDGVVGIDGQVDFVRAKFDATGNVPRIPPLRYGGGIFYEDEALSGRVGLTRVSGQSDVATNETTTGGYTLLDADFGYRFGTGDFSHQVRLVGSNLLNRDARNHISFKKADVLLPGRSVRLVLTSRF